MSLSPHAHISLSLSLIRSLLGSTKRPKTKQNTKDQKRRKKKKKGIQKPEIREQPSSSPSLQNRRAKKKKRYISLTHLTTTQVLYNHQPRKRHRSQKAPTPHNDKKIRLPHSQKGQTRSLHTAKRGSNTSSILEAF